MLSCSPKFCKGDEQALLKTSEIHAMARGDDKRALLMKAEAFPTEARKIMTTVSLSDSMRCTFLGLLDVRVVHHVCSKVDESRGTFKSLQALGRTWVQELSDTLGQPVQCPWAAAPDAPAPSAQQAPKGAGGVKVFSSSGDWANSADAVAAKGFTVDSSARHVGTSTIRTVHAIGATTVELSDACGTVSSHSHGVFLENQYVLHTDTTDNHTITCFEQAQATQPTQPTNNASITKPTQPTQAAQAAQRNQPTNSTNDLDQRSRPRNNTNELLQRI